jgi:hypothetical protein
MGDFLPSCAAKSPKSQFFPVLSLLISESEPESGSHQTVASAKQSASIAFSPENSKTARICADILIPKGTGEAQIRWSVAAD